MSARLALLLRWGDLAIVGLLAFLTISNSPFETCAADAPAAKSWRVEGRVTDDQGKPVAGIEVFANDLPYLRLAKQPMTRSDREGRYVLEVAGRLNGRMIRASQQDGRQQASKQLPYEVEKDTSVPPLDLVVRQAREMDCTVVDTNGHVVAGATVLVTGGYEQFALASTDEQGCATLRVPADLPLQAVVAFKPEIGLDYWLFRAPKEPKSNPYKLAADYAAPLQFVLNGTRNVTVRVVDDRDQPLANAKVYPWLLEKPNKGDQRDQLNLSGLTGFSRQTDDRGVATFDYIPSDNTRPINFWARVEGFFSPERHIYDPVSGVSELVAKLVPLVSVAGRVEFADGRPAAEIEVQASGAGYGMDQFRESTRTDTSGHFTFRVYPDQFYSFAAGNRQAASPGLYQVVRR